MICQNEDFLYFKDLILRIVAFMESKRVRQLTKLIITAFSFENPHLGARFQDVDRMLKSVSKGRIKNKCDEIRKMLTICIGDEQI